ncbi:replication protein A 70 kDa DNA-binding subunit B-like [Nicotiana tomentosiformis]
MAYSLLTELNSTRDDWTVRVRVCRKWNSINFKRNRELMSTDMILIDEEETLIHATINKNLVNKYKNLLSEGSVYVIKNFKVSEASGVYRPVTSTFKISFFLTTALQELREGIVSIPINGFQFIKPDMIDSRLNNNTVLSDVVGCLTAIGDMESVGSKWKKRDIQVITDYSAKSKITLWEEFGEKFEPFLYNDSGPYVVIVTSTTVKQFRGEVTFATTYASKIYVNLEIDYITTLIQKFGATFLGVQTIGSSNVNNIPIEEEMFMNRMNITELLESDWSADIHEYIVTVRGNITEIDNYFDWYYISCNSCSKKIVPSNGVYTCLFCAKECKFPLVKYKIYVKVKDKTGKTTLVLFNAVAEKLLDTSAHKLFNRLSLESNNVPPQIQSLCGKEFIFKLRLNNYNLKEGLENYTVSKLFIPDENLELQYTTRKEQKGKKKVEDNIETKRFVEGKESTNVSLEDFEDSPEDPHVNDGVNCRGRRTSLRKIRKRRNLIINDDEVIEQTTKKSKK